MVEPNRAIVIKYDETCSITESTTEDGNKVYTIQLCKFFFLVRTSAKSTSVYTNFRQEDRVFTFSCEFEKEAVPDDIAEPNEDGLVSSTTDSTTTKITNSAQSRGDNTGFPKPSICQMYFDYCFLVPNPDQLIDK